MTTDQAAEYTTLAARTLRKLVKEGAIPFHRHGRRLIFLRGELDDWLASKRVV